VGGGARELGALRNVWGNLISREGRDEAFSRSGESFLYSKWAGSLLSSYGDGQPCVIFLNRISKKRTRTGPKKKNKVNKDVCIMGRDCTFEEKVGRKERGRVRR